MFNANALPKEVNIYFKQLMYFKFELLFVTSFLVNVEYDYLSLVRCGKWNIYLPCFWHI